MTLRLNKAVKDSLLEDYEGGEGYTPQELSSICILDNHYKDANC